MEDHREDETREELRQRVQKTFADRGSSYEYKEQSEAGSAKGKKPLDDILLRGVLIGLIVIVAAVVLNMVYVSRMDGKFYHFTSVNHFDVTGLAPQEAAAQLSDICETTFVNFYEGSKMELSLTLADMGYTLDMADLLEELQQIEASQRRIFPIHIFGSKNYELKAALVLDNEKLSEMVSEDTLLTPRVKTENAYLAADEKGAYIVPEVYGTEFDSWELRQIVRESVAESALEPQGGVITVEITDDMYKKPSILKDDEDLTAKEEVFSKYVDSKIIYEFGEQTEEVGWDIIQTWIKSDVNGARLDEETMYNFIYDLASKYNTVFEERTFKTTYGYSIQIPRNEYGYRIDYDGEYFQLLDDLEKGGEVRREPVYEISGFSRNGRDDLNGSYIEVDLSAQHLWMYYEGGLVVETDIVSGLPTEERETVDGAFAIPYKESPANLVGQGGSGQQTWDVEVDYWMPFCDGQGLHDAKWRGSFGGTLYKAYGSHGCVNLPEYAAAMIYSYCRTNYPIILYKS